MGALDRDHVGRLLDHADQGAVALRVGADPAERPLGEVEAFLAEADLLLHFADRLAERERLFVGRPQQVEGEPLRGPLADPGQPRELGDEARERRWSLGAHLAITVPARRSRRGAEAGLNRRASRRGRRPCRR